MNITLTVRLSVRWWFRLYIKLLSFCCIVSGREPDMNKVCALAKYGIKVHSKPEYPQWLTDLLERIKREKENK